MRRGNRYAVGIDYLGWYGTHWFMRIGNLPFGSFGTSGHERNLILPMSLCEGSSRSTWCFHHPGEGHQYYHRSGRWAWAVDTQLSDSNAWWECLHSYPYLGCASLKWNLSLSCSVRSETIECYDAYATLRKERSTFGSSFRCHPKSMRYHGLVFRGIGMSDVDRQSVRCKFFLQQTQLQRWLFP